MKYLAILIFVVTAQTVSYGQTSLASLQGIWKEHVDGFESYVVINGHNWHTITILDGEVDVSLDWFGFLDSKDLEVLNPRSLADTGMHIVFLTYRKSIPSYNDSLDINYYNFYQYDLGGNSFTYYANYPVSLTRLESLPQSVLKQFDIQKSTLTYFKELEE
ncbi:MAG: hypothetical protein ACMVP2_26030 [Imperialibacter sp.]|uniref:hypothetical protein n=1 Tax=Imperialibacter sp. TaxID=2038411 RepID=UPI003A8B8AB1